MCFALQAGLRGFLIFFNILLCGLHLRLRLAARLVTRICADLQCRLTASFLGTEYRGSRFAQPLFVFGGAGIGGRNIGPGFFHCAFCLAAALFQHALQRRVHNHRIQRVQQSQQNYRGDRSEQ